MTHKPDIIIAIDTGKSGVAELDALRTLLSYEREGLRLNKTGY